MKLDEDRRKSRRIMDQLSVGERFMLLFGRGVLKHDPLRVEPIRVLRLTLKRRWFDMIASGEKKEEYRRPGKWINSRIHGKTYDRVEFKNGYGPNVPTVAVEYKGSTHGIGRPEWGGTGDHVLVIHLGRVLSVTECGQCADKPQPDHTHETP